MSKKNDVIAAIRKLASELGRAPSRDETRKVVTDHSIRHAFPTFADALKAAGLCVVRPNVRNDEGLRIAKMTEELRDLKSYVVELESETINAKVLRDLIGSVDASEIGKDSGWIKGAKHRASGVTGIPVLFLSDIHFDEIVKPSEINFVNSYNHDIAVKRLQHTFNTSITLLKKHMVAPNYDGIVCALGGDLLSGNIHEELAETNEQRINKSVFDLADILAVGIGELADEFGRVFVPCVVGNHGRQHKKPRAKGKVIDNYEWIIYQLLVRQFKSDGRVSFLVPESADAHFQVYGKKICLTHGDQFKGGEGVGGIMVPIMRGLGKKQSRQQAIGQGFDLTMMGHWHQYIQTRSLLINGSVKGYDEYAYISNFSFERPQQALFVLHPDHGVTFSMPILCDGYDQNAIAVFDRKAPKLIW